MKSAGFTGTRYGMTDLQATVFEGLIGDIDLFRHGSCQGADVQAARIVRKTYTKHVQIVAHPGPLDDSWKESSGVDDEIMPGKTHFARNRDIVNLTDKLYATPDQMSEWQTGGTWYTINYAVKVGKPVTIIYPDGSIETR